jgi:hypothetical protein
MVVFCLSVKKWLLFEKMGDRGEKRERRALSLFISPRALPLLHSNTKVKEFGFLSLSLSLSLYGEEEEEERKNAKKTKEFGGSKKG